MDKIVTRNCAKFIRTKLNLYSISNLMVERIRELPEYKEARVVLLYYPKVGELDLTALVEDDKEFCLPRIEQRILQACPWKLGDELVLSTFQVQEPLTTAINPMDIDLIITPGLCADVQRNRLGYGKGCYDEFIPRTNAVTIFPVPDELLFNQIPSEAHDIKPDIVITPTKIIH